MGVAPGGEALAAVGILASHVHAAGVGDTPVDDSDLAVVAVVDLVPLRRVGVDVRAGLAQRSKLLLAVRERAHPVVEDAHLDTLGDLLGEQIAHASGELVLLPDEVLEMDRVLGGLYVCEQAAELLGATAHDLEARARKQPGAVLRLDGAGDASGERVPANDVARLLGVALVERPDRAVAFLEGGEPAAVAAPQFAPVAAEQEVEHDAHAGQREQHEHPRERGRRVALVVDERERDKDHDHVQDRAEDLEVGGWQEVHRFRVYRNGRATRRPIGDRGRSRAGDSRGSPSRNTLAPLYCTHDIRRTWA